jgi:hypothetical protein
MSSIGSNMGQFPIPAAPLLPIDKVFQILLGSEGFKISCVLASELLLTWGQRRSAKFRLSKLLYTVLCVKSGTAVH